MRAQTYQGNGSLPENHDKIKPLMAANKHLRVAIIGARETDEDARNFAYAVGKLLAEQGAIVYTGGAAGIMRAAGKGVRAGKGVSVGILKETDLSQANEYVDIPVMTGMGDLRNGIIIRSVQGAIAVDGAYGTLSEIAYTLSDNKPVVAYRSWDIEGVRGVDTPEEAVDTLLSLIAEE